MPPSLAPSPEERVASRPARLLAGGIVAGVAVGIVLATAIHFLMNESEGGQFSRTALQQSMFFGLWGAIIVPLWLGTARLEEVESAWVRASLIVATGIVVWIVHGAVVAGLLAARARSRARAHERRAAMWKTITNLGTHQVTRWMDARTRRDLQCEIKSPAMHMMGVTK